MSDTTRHAEMQLLSELMQGDGVYDEYRSLLGDLHDKVFMDSRNASIYRVVSSRYESGLPVDAMQVIIDLESTGLLSAAGNKDYVLLLPELSVSGAYMDKTAMKCADLFHKDRARKIGERIVKASLNGVDIHDIAEKSIVEFQKMLEVGFTDNTRRIGDISDEVMSDFEQAKAGHGVFGISSGLFEVDQKTGGWEPCDLIVIGARPSRGKSNSGFNFILAAAKECPVGFVSIEMPAKRVTRRSMAILGGFNDFDMARGYLSNDDAIKAVQAQSEIKGLPIFINDRAGITLTEICALAKKWRRERKIKLLVIDYLQIIQDKTRRSREEEVGRAALTLKNLARSLEIPIIVLAQLNRGIDGRPKDPPRMGDLRESGQIEQHADKIILLHDFHKERIHIIPEGYGRFSGQSSEGLLYYGIEKSRYAGTGAVFVRFNKQTGRITCAEVNENPPEAYHNEDPAPF